VEGSPVVDGVAVGVVGAAGTADGGGAALGTSLVTLGGGLGCWLETLVFDVSLAVGLVTWSDSGPDFDAPQAVVHIATSPTARLRQTKGRKKGARETDATESELIRAVCATRGDRSQTTTCYLDNGRDLRAVVDHPVP